MQKNILFLANLLLQFYHGSWYFFSYLPSQEIHIFLCFWFVSNYIFWKAKWGLERVNERRKLGMYWKDRAGLWQSRSLGLHASPLPELRGTSTWAMSHCCPACLCRNLNHKWNSQSAQLCSIMGCWHHTSGLTFFFVCLLQFRSCELYLILRNIFYISFVSTN